MESGNFWFAFGVTLFAGLSTGIGSGLAFFARRTNTRMLASALGFSAGVMIYVSFMEILPKAEECILTAASARQANMIAVGAFFAGILVLALIDNLIPSFENPHEMHKVEELDDKKREAIFSQKMMRTGVFAALAIGIHNFPEGFATFASALTDVKLGIAIAIAIAIHNIPEGIAVSIPIFYATGSKKKAFSLSFLSGVSEPVGALIGYLFLRSFMSNMVFGVVFAGVAGLMVYISFDELLPSAEEYGEHHLTIIGTIAGMAVMAGSLLLLG